MKRQIYIDPSYSSFNSDRLFDLNDKNLNRDDQLKPFVRLRDYLKINGNSVCTADFLIDDCAKNESNSDYISLDIIENYEKIHVDKRARMAAFVIMEPPVVAPHLYAELGKLTKLFERVYVHNTHGDGYSLEGVDKNKLHKMFYPVPYNDLLEPCWSNSERRKRFVVINGNHDPSGKKREPCSLRINRIRNPSRANIFPQPLDSDTADIPHCRCQHIGTASNRSFDNEKR